MLRHLQLVVFVLSSIPSSSQITGTLKAPNGNLEVGAVVFINRSSLRAVTDDFGRFALPEVPAGVHELVAYQKGFPLYRAPMRVQSGRAYTLNLTFGEQQKKPKGKSTPEAKAAFETALLGTDRFLFWHPDTEVIVEAMNGKFRVLSGPIVIDFPNAGYRITAYFPAQSFQSVADAAYCYQEYQGSNIAQNMSVERSRLEIYNGSIRHWLASLIRGKSREEGFTEYDADNKEMPATKVMQSSTTGYSRILLDQPIRVRYMDRKSSMLSAAGLVDANDAGIMLNPRALTIEGPMERTSLSGQLPLDYKPIEDIEGTYAEALRYFYEKIYLQTDKPYYYPGEPLWFKAYINYYNRTWKDSLSDVLYVELLNVDQQIKLEHMHRIADGVSYGDFILPDSLPEGTYYLRAYTNLRLNFGTSGLFTKPLRILSATDKAAAIQHPQPPDNSALSILPNQQRYQLRERIALDLATSSGIAANLSIAVTDAAQVIAIPDPMNILNSYPIKHDEIPAIKELTRRIERGISFYGQFLNKAGEPEKTQLTFIEWKTGDVLYAETGDDGMFWQTGLQFTDSARFSYKSDKAKRRPYGTVVILPREKPPLEVPPSPNFQVVKAGTVQRIFSEYEVPRDSRLMEELEVRAPRIEETDFERSKRRPFGKPDYILSGKDLNVNSGNLLYALVGKVPGLVVNPAQGVVYFSRSLASSITQSGGPMVTVNDVPMAGDAGTILQTIDFNTITSIEFTKRMNVLYGASGAYGVISVYTRFGPGRLSDPNFQTITLPGFSKTRSFRAPEYNQAKTDASVADYRSTLYWNPDLKVDPATGKATVEFFASDLSGLYRVVVEGVTAGGKPLRAETYLTVGEKP